MADRRVQLAGVCVCAVFALCCAWAGSAWGASPGAFAWGYDTDGVLGVGAESGESLIPLPITGLGEVQAIAGGNRHALALLADGTVMAWGSNDLGQLGDGGTSDSDVPVPVEDLSEVTAISAGGDSSDALLDDGTVMAWGGNSHGQLGDGSTEKSEVPVPVSGLTEAIAVAQSGEHALALLADGTVMAWGDDEDGQLGDGQSGAGHDSDVPVEVEGLSEVTAIAAGNGFSLALLRDGEVRAWGDDEVGQLGNGHAFEGNSDVPVPVAGLAGVTAISAGEQHAMALLSDGRVMSWGSDEFRQLGHPEVPRVPQEVPGPTGATAVVAAGYHSFALLGGGRIVAWGLDERDELGVPAPHEREIETPTAVSCDLQGIEGIASGFFAGYAWGAADESCPVVGGVTPDEGPPGGGTTVTIHGSGFGGATSVAFGGAAAEEFEVISPQEITAVTPPGSETVNVTVTTPIATSEQTGNDRFTYLALPTIADLLPDAGNTDRRITIVGTNFTTATAVHFGAASASFTVKSATEIAAFPPAGAGVVDVTVTNAEGTSETTPADRFAYEQTPEYGRCVLDGPGEDVFGQDSCTLVSKTSPDYAWEPAFGGRDPLAKLGFTMFGNLTFATAAKTKLACTAEGAGEYTGKQTLSLGALTLKCSLTEGKFYSFCSSAGAGPREVITVPLVTQLGFVKVKKSHEAAIEIGPASGSTIAEFTCGPDAVTLAGGAIATVPEDDMRTGWSSSAKKGKPSLTELEGGAEAVPELKVGAGGYVEAGLTGGISQTSEEAVGVSTVA